MNAETAIQTLNELLQGRTSICKALEESMKSIKKAENEQNSILFNGNQKFLERLKKLASERLHPHDEGFELKLLKGKSKKERLMYHETFIQRIDKISTDMQPHFESLRDALHYQADILSLFSNLSNILKYNQALDPNIVFKLGTLVHVLLSISVLITRHEIPEAILFVYNLAEVKRNLGDSDVCRQVNTETFKALRQFQGFDQTNIIKSLRKSISFDINLVNLFNYIVHSVYPEYLNMTRKDIRENRLESLLDCYSNILKTGRPNLNLEELVLETREQALIQHDMSSSFDILISVYLLCPTLFLISEDNHADKLKNVASHLVQLKLYNEKLPIHEYLSEMIHFFPNKKKMRRKSKANQVLTFSQFLSRNIEVEGKGKENHALNSFDSETVHSNMESFEGQTKQPSSTFEQLSVKDFLVQIDIEGLKESLLEAKTGASLFVEETMLNFESLYSLLCSTTMVITNFPEVSGPLFGQISNLIYYSRSLLDNADKFFAELIEYTVKKKSDKISSFIFKHALLGKLKHATQPENFLKLRVKTIKGSLEKLEIAVAQNAQSIRDYTGEVTNGVDIQDLEEKLLAFNVHSEFSNEFGNTQASYKDMLLIKFLKTFSSEEEHDPESSGSHGASIESLVKLFIKNRDENTVDVVKTKLEAQIKLDRLQRKYDTVARFQKKLKVNEAALVKIYASCLDIYVEQKNEAILDKVLKLVGKENANLLKAKLIADMETMVTTIKKSMLSSSLKDQNEESIVDSLMEFFSTLWKMASYSEILQKQFSHTQLTEDQLKLPITLMKKLLKAKIIFSSKNVLGFCQNITSLLKGQNETIVKEINKEVYAIVNMFWIIKARQSTDTSSDEMALYTYVKRTIGNYLLQPIPLQCI